MLFQTFVALVELATAAEMAYRFLLQVDSFCMLVKMQPFLEYLFTIFKLAPMLLVLSIHVLVELRLGFKFNLTSWAKFNLLIVSVERIPMISEGKISFTLVVTLFTLVALNASVALVHVLVE